MRTENPAVAAGGAAAGVENHGQMEPVIHSDTAGDNEPGQQEQKQKENEEIQ